MNEITKVNIPTTTSWDKFAPYTFSSLLVIIAPKNIKAIGHIKVGIRLVMSVPALFLNNFVSFSKVTLLNFTKMITTMIKLGISPIVRNPAVIPQENAKFQKLSLLHLAFIKPNSGVTTFVFLLTDWIRGVFFGNPFSFLVFKSLKSCMGVLLDNWFKIYKTILAKFLIISKKISFLILSIIVFSASMVFGEQKNKRLDQQLRNYISFIEKKNNIPSGLLLAIGNVESSLNPYVINIEGRAVFSKSYNDAIIVAKKALESGVTNIDFGLMQINYRWHNEQFENFKEMLRPKINIKYAGKLLAQLYKEHGCWHQAVRYYHSSNREHNIKYSRKVVLQWLKSTT